MSSVSECSLSSGLTSTPKFALVSYIPEPLAGFLDRLRLDLDPTCKPHAHVTLLPPRMLCSSQDRAVREIRDLSRQFRPFTIHLSEIEKFPVSNVIHVGLASGRERLLDMHRTMNCGANRYKEGFEYCPHVTIAQNLDEAVVEETLKRAQDAWQSYPFERSFLVDRLAFVRSLDCATWTDIEDFPLSAAPPTSSITRTSHPEPHLA